MKKKFLFLSIIVAIFTFCFVPLMKVNAGITDGGQVSSHTTIVKTETANEEVPYNTDLEQYILNKKTEYLNSLTSVPAYNDEWLALYVSEGGVYKYPVFLQTVFTGVTVNGNNAVLVGDLDQITEDTTAVYNYEARYREVTVVRGENPNKVNTVNINLTAPIVGDKVLPVGWTGTDTENIIDDGTMDPDTCPTATTSTTGVSIDSAYFITGTYLERPDDWELLFFGTFERDTYYYADIAIETTGDYVFGDNLSIKINGEAPAEVFGILNDGTFTHFIAKIKAKVDMDTYTLEDNDSIISFKDEKGRVFAYSFTDLLTLADEDLDEEQMEMILEFIAKVKESTKANGTLIGLYDIVLSDGGVDVHTAESSFKIKIKLTDEMKKYNTFKLIYINDDGEAETVTNLTKEGDYLVGTVSHLSVYALTGSVTSSAVNPPTGDNIALYIAMFGIGIVGLVGAAIYMKKKKIF
ncbi:MAG: hypothetical protein IJI43_01185 [Bacilli bacterium]|nr:hypothetical protein [Bacilli bacterium]